MNIERHAVEGLSPGPRKTEHAQLYRAGQREEDDSHPDDLPPRELSVPSPEATEECPRVLGLGLSVKIIRQCPVRGKILR